MARGGWEKSAAEEMFVCLVMTATPALTILGHAGHAGHVGDENEAGLMIGGQAQRNLASGR